MFWSEFCVNEIYFLWKSDHLKKREFLRLNLSSVDWGAFFWPGWGGLTVRSGERGECEVEKTPPVVWTVDHPGPTSASRSIYREYSPLLTAAKLNKFLLLIRSTTASLTLHSLCHLSQPGPHWTTAGQVSAVDQWESPTRTT